MTTAAQSTEVFPGSTGLRRLRPDDHFMILTETPQTPIQLGALISLQLPDGYSGSVFETLRDHFLVRLASTPLLAELHQAPDGYDSDVWADVAACDPEIHFERNVDAVDHTQLEAAAARNTMRPLDLSLPPFRFAIFEDIGGGRCAIQLTVHHCVTDGVGLQTMLGNLSDESPPHITGRRAAILPPDDQWLAASATRFADEAPLRAHKRELLDAARTRLKSGEFASRMPTPVLKLSGPTSGEREYTRISLELARISTIAKRTQSTVNDIFLAVASSAIRRYLLEIDDLPESPIVVNSARSYRRPEHGDFGNRIVALHPHLATDLADPMERLRAIKDSMATW